MLTSIHDKPYESVVYSHSTSRTWYASKFLFIRIIQKASKGWAENEKVSRIIFGKDDSELINREKIALKASFLSLKYYGKNGVNLVKLGKENHIKIVPTYHKKGPLAFFKPAKKLKKWFVFINREALRVEKEKNPIRYFDPKLAIAHEFGHLLMPNQKGFTFLKDFKEKYRGSIWYLFSFIVEEQNIAALELDADLFSYFCLFPYPKFDMEIYRDSTQPLKGFLDLSERTGVSIYTCIKRFFYLPTFSTVYFLWKVSIYLFLRVKPMEFRCSIPESSNLKFELLPYAIGSSKMKATRNALIEGKRKGISEVYYSSGRLKDFVIIKSDRDIIDCEVEEQARCLHLGEKFAYIATFLVLKAPLLGIKSKNW